MLEQAVQLDVEVTAASAVQSLAVHHHGEIRVLKQRMNAQNCNARLTTWMTTTRSVHQEQTSRASAKSTIELPMV